VWRAVSAQTRRRKPRSRSRARWKLKYQQRQQRYRRRRATLLLVIEFIKIKIKRRAVILFRKTRPCEASAGRSARDNRSACGELGKISGRNYLSRRKSYEFSIKRVYVVRRFIMYRSTGAVCSPLPAGYKLFNLRMNGEILADAQTCAREEEKETYLSYPRERESPENTSNEYPLPSSSLLLLPAPRNLSRRQKNRGADGRGAGGSRNTREKGNSFSLPTPSVAATSMLPVTRKFTSSSRSSRTSTLSRETREKSAGEEREKEREREAELLISFYQPLSVTLILVLCASFIY